MRGYSSGQPNGVRQFRVSEVYVGLIFRYQRHFFCGGGEAGWRFGIPR